MPLGNQPSIRVLVVEDEPDHFALIDALIQDFDPDRFELVSEPRLGSARTRLETERFDLLLLAPGRPDGPGLGALAEFDRAGALPATIVLISPTNDRAASVARRRDTRDHPIESRIDGPILARALAYALERDRLQRELEEARLDAQQSELVLLRKMADDADQPSGDLGPVLDDYTPVLRNYVAALRTGEVRPAEPIGTLAVRLANRRARARDVTRMHLAALDRVAAGMSPREQRRLADDARLALIEILGDLADLYRPTEPGTP